MSDAQLVRAMTADDLPWVVEVTRQRRESLVPHAPRFWRPAANATERHREFLASLVQDSGVLSVRTQNGYLIAINRGPVWLVDDAVVTDHGDWGTEGVQLLRHAREHGGPLRVVVPVFETSRLAAARSVGLAPVEHWWHRDLEPVHLDLDGADSESDIAVDGAEGRLVPAPPVYDPGGQVLLVTDVVDRSSLRRIESAAAKRGACVSVVTQRPEDSDLEALLDGAGYSLTTAFCESPVPRPPRDSDEPTRR